MKVEQIYTNCIAQGAYYIESEGEVAIIDPLREAKTYLQKAEENNANIKYVFETHFHADFVSGHQELAQLSNAKIIYGNKANPDFEAYLAEDGEEFLLGKIKIRALHTPGHTLESVCYLLIDEQNNPYCIFTGDTLFIGDVGRPDLAQKSDITTTDLATMLYHSLQNKIMPLNDEVIIYPAHGAGSACGKNMSKETFDTLGNQKNTNYALLAKTKEDFVKNVTEGLTAPPNYFPENVRLNKQGTIPLSQVLENALKPLSVKDFKEILKKEKDILILDTRTPQTFCKGFIKNALNIGLNGQFAPWVGNIITNINQKILLVTDPNAQQESIIRLARVGYHNVLGYLEGGIEAWTQAKLSLEQIESISPDEYFERSKNDFINTIDIRRNGEYQAGHLINTLNLPLEEIYEWTENGKVFPLAPYHIHCAGGYRSMIACSLLHAKGFEVVDVAGGFTAIQKAKDFGEFKKV